MSNRRELLRAESAPVMDQYSPTYYRFDAVGLCPQCGAEEHFEFAWEPDTGHLRSERCYKCGALVQLRLCVDDGREAEVPRVGVVWR